jgi:hypothetical protein
LGEFFFFQYRTIFFPTSDDSVPDIGRLSSQRRKLEIQVSNIPRPTSDDVIETIFSNAISLTTVASRYEFPMKVVLQTHKGCPVGAKFLEIGSLPKNGLELGRSGQLKMLLGGAPGLLTRVG